MLATWYSSRLVEEARDRLLERHVIDLAADGLILGVGDPAYA